MENYKVSIIMPVNKDRGNFVKSVNSIFSQSYKNSELIIIDDSGNASIYEKFKELNNVSIKWVINESNQGITKSLNSGILNADGDLIARIDEGDIWKPEKLRLQIAEFLKDEQIVLVGTQYNEIYPTGTKFNGLLPTDNFEIRKWLLCGKNPMAHSSVLFKNCKILYNEMIKAAEDFELWVRLSLVGKLVNLKEPLIEYDRTTLSISDENKFNQWMYPNIISQMFRELLLNGSIEEFKMIHKGGFRSEMIIRDYEKLNKKHMRVIFNKFKRGNTFTSMFFRKIFLAIFNQTALKSYIHKSLFKILLKNQS